MDGPRNGWVARCAMRPVAACGGPDLNASAARIRPRKSCASATGQTRHGVSCLDEAKARTMLPTPSQKPERIYPKKTSEPAHLDRLRGRSTLAPHGKSARTDHWPWSTRNSSLCESHHPNPPNRATERCGRDRCIRTGVVSEQESYRKSRGRWHEGHSPHLRPMALSPSTTTYTYRFAIGDPLVLAESNPTAAIMGAWAGSGFCL